MVIPELIRLLLERGITMDEAVELVTKACAYTNHTILSEALEKWPLAYLEKVVPQLVLIIKELDKRAKAKYSYASRCIENEILMYLRRNSKRKTEVSIDEPLNVDWDGNELLLSDILGTDEDMVYRDMEEEAERRQLSNALSKLPSRERRIVELRYGINTDDDREMTQKDTLNRGREDM